MARSLLLFVAALTLLAAAPATAQEPPPTAPTTTLVEGGDLPGVIPRPNQGREPQQPGDPGGWLQLTLAGIVVLAVGLVFTIVVRSAARTTRSKRIDETG
jgi:hypothetical protein